jgi:hypothetical protein
MALQQPFKLGRQRIKALVCSTYAVNGGIPDKKNRFIDILFAGLRPDISQKAVITSLIGTDKTDMKGKFQQNQSQYKPAQQFDCHFKGG